MVLNCSLVGMLSSLVKLLILSDMYGYFVEAGFIWLAHLLWKGFCVVWLGMAFSHLLVLRTSRTSEEKSALPHIVPSRY